MTTRRSAAVLAMLLGLGVLGLSGQASAQDARANLESLPEPSLEAMAEPVQEALTEARERVDSVAAEDGNDAALAGAYGNLADVAFAHDQTPLARTAYRNALVLRPDRQEWHYLLGLLEISDGNLEAGIASLTRALELYPQDHVALVRRGRAFLETGEFERAASDFEQAAQIAPTSPAVLGGLGRAGLQLGEHEAAVNLLSEALERAPQATALHQPLGLAYRALGDTERARQHLSQSGEVREPLNDPVLDRVRRLSRSPQFYLEAGLGRAEQGNYNEAVALLERARELMPEDDRILRELGEVQARAGRFDAARETFAELVKSPGVDAEAYFLLGQVEEFRGNFDAAIAAYGDALSIDGGYADARESIAFALFNKGDNEAADARFTQLAEAAESAADQARFIYWRAIVDLDEGRCGDAATKLERAHGLTEEGNADVLTALARIRATCQPADDAALEEALEWAVAIYDVSPGIDSAATRAMVHAARGEFEDAVDFQTQAVFEALKRYGDVESRPDLREEMERYREEQPAGRPFGDAHPVFSPGLAGW